MNSKPLARKKYKNRDTKRELLEPEILYQAHDNNSCKFRLVLNESCELKWENSERDDSMKQPIWKPMSKIPLPDKLDIDGWETIFELAKVVLEKSQEEKIISHLKQDVGFSTKGEYNYDDDDEVPF